MDIFNNKIGSCVGNVALTFAIALFWSLGLSWVAWIMVAVFMIAVMTTYFISTKMPKIVDGKISKFIDINDEESPVASLLNVAKKSKITTKDALNFDAVTYLICAVLLYAFVTSSVLFFCLQLVLITFSYLTNETLLKYVDVFKANGGVEKSFATSKDGTPVVEEPVSVPTIDTGSPEFTAAAAEVESDNITVDGQIPLEPEAPKKEKGE